MKQRQVRLPETPSQGKARLVEVEEVAEMLKCSVRHVYRLADRGRMPRPVRLGGIVRWSKSELERWIEDGCPDTRQNGRRGE